MYSKNAPNESLVRDKKGFLKKDAYLAAQSQAVKYGISSKKVGQI
jgi:hypothetical protein